MERIDHYVVVLENPTDYLNPNSDPDETDLLPEFCCYQDEGCELAPSCLNCPFPRCADEFPQGRKKLTKIVWDREILRLRTVEKKRVKELMKQFNLSRRSITTALASGRVRNESD